MIEGEFPTGTELMLWRPGIDRTRLRRRALCAGPFLPRLALGFMLIAIGAVPGHVNWLVLAIGVLLLAGSVLALWIDYQCADYDHQHGPAKPCFFDRTRGEYFYHPSDFRDLPPSTVHSVIRIIIAVHDVHVSPASTWLDPQHVREIHHVAWNALRALDRTRSLRILVDDPHYQAIPDDLDDAQACLTMVDDTIDGIVDHLDQVRFLVHAWEQKLAEAGLRAQLRAELDNVRDNTITSTLRRAESLPENVFAYVTAARDVTNAGGFIWERARP